MPSLSKNVDIYYTPKHAPKSIFYTASCRFFVLCNSRSITRSFRATAPHYCIITIFITKITQDVWFFDISPSYRRSARRRSDNARNTNVWIRPFYRTPTAVYSREKFSFAFRACWAAGIAMRARNTCELLCNRLCTRDALSCAILLRVLPSSVALAATNPHFRCALLCLCSPHRRIRIS